MRFAQVVQGLSHTRDLLRPIIQVDNVLVDEARNTLTWRNRISGIVKNVYYPIEYQHLIDNRQYSFLLTDGSFLQFFYEFEGLKKPKSVRLALYPPPVSVSATTEELLEAADEALDRQDDHLYEHLYNWVELMEAKSVHPTNTSHVRFDFDSSVKVHEKAHLQFGAITELRVGADFIPQPIAFVELVASLINGLGPLAGLGLRHAKNNCGDLNAVSRLISIRKSA
ncbi:uncharacterized protein DUF2290 [Cupriavidus alkaliphilus]|uniref:DUF2290 domain-containing protein n=1 Tax=Cupriavidus alkaliphilus TaxID=942866 RepID=UPI000DE73689|nr:DUF2290 domain-containing protein [Cupriavidus alkaliphilus]PVY69448.1 uncharacterized protein DUF2290 [Cupriavidus alkaliphilus]